MPHLAAAPPVRALVNGSLIAASTLSSRRSVVDPAKVQAAQLRLLLRRARNTRFGRDHDFDAVLHAGRRRAGELVEAFGRAVPLRTYEQLWDEYLAGSYPVLRDLTWPGLIPYFALTSGTTQGATKYIPVSREMLASNRAASWSVVRSYLARRPQSRLFRGKMFFLGGSTALEEPAPGIRQGDLSAITTLEVKDSLRPFLFPPLEIALESDWERKLDLLARLSLREPIAMVGGVPSWLLMLFQRVLELSGAADLSRAWPGLEVVVHGGVKFDPYHESFRAVLGSDRIALQETYPCSEGFIAFGDAATGLLRLKYNHGLFYEFVPADEIDSPRPTRHWLGNVRPGVNYAIVVSSCAGLWSHVVGDTVRFESLSPPLLSFTGRTKYTLSAFGEHLISEEVESAIAEASAAAGASVRDWHVGPVFDGALGHHRFLVEFIAPPADFDAFRGALDASLRRRNADYDAHRIDGVGLPLPALVEAGPNGFVDWMRALGKLGGQHKVPRMDNSGSLTAGLDRFLRDAGRIRRELAPGPPPHAASA